MRVRVIAFAFGLVLGLLAALSPAAEVEVLAPSAEVKVGDKTVATVKQGQRLRLLQLKGPWVAVSLGDGDGEQRGWLLADKVRRLVEPGLKTAPGPEAPVDLRIDADWLQVLTSPDNSTHYLFVRLKLVNETLDPARISVNDIRLLVDGEPLTALQPNPNNVAIAAPGDGPWASFGAGRGFGLPPRLRRFGGFGGFGGGGPATSPDSDRSPNRDQEDAARIQLPAPLVPEGEPPFAAGDLLQDAELQPGDEVAGWMCFDLKPLADALEEPAVVARKSWLLEAKRGNRKIEFDLKAGEIAKLGAASRPSKYDASVRVLEVAPHINALNLGSFVALLDAVADEEEGFALVFKAGDRLIDDYAAELWSQPEWWSQFRNLGNLGLPFFPIIELLRSRFGVGSEEEAAIFVLQGRGHSSVGSEEEAAILVLEGRGAVAALLPFLNSQSAAARQTAAERLRAHLKDEEVVSRLISAASDSEPSVRATALASLGGKRRYDEKTVLWPEDSPAAIAIRNGMRDSEASVRETAASAAETAWSGIQEELFGLLVDENAWVRFTACVRLGELKSQAVIARLKQLQAGLDKQLAAGAISSLERMGELNATEAALARLECGHPDWGDFDELVKAKELRAVPALLAQLQTEDSFSVQAAQALGELKAKEAVEPLLEVLLESQYEPSWTPGERIRPRRARVRLRWLSPDHIVALGKLGDPRAIEPLRNALRRETNDTSRRMACYEALLLLEVPGAYRELAGELDDAEDASEVDMTLRLLATYGGEKAIATIEPYLDRKANVHSAAAALTLAPSPLAAKVMESRLRRADYRFGPQVLEAVSSNETWLKSQVGKTLLQKAAASENESTKAAAAELIKSLALIEFLEQEPDGSKRSS